MLMGAGSISRAELDPSNGGPRGNDANGVFLFTFLSAIAVFGLCVPSMDNQDLAVPVGRSPSAPEESRRPAVLPPRPALS